MLFPTAIATLGVSEMAAIDCANAWKVNENTGIIQSDFLNETMIFSENEQREM